MSALLLTIAALLAPGRFEHGDTEVYWLLGTGLTGVGYQVPGGDYRFDAAGVAIEMMRLHHRQHAVLVPGYGGYAEFRYGHRGADGALGVRAFLTGLGLDLAALATADGVGVRFGGFISFGPVMYRGTIDFVGDREIETNALTLQMQWFFEDGGMRWVFDPPPERRPPR